MSETMANTMKKKLNKKSVIATIVFGAIILVFVFLGMPGAMGPGVGYVARVNDSLISLADYQQEQNRVQEYYKNLFGDQMDLGPQRQMLGQQAVENLVRSELVFQAAFKNDILATDAEVRNFIVKDISFFQLAGVFQKDYYMNYLTQTRMTPAHFEGKVRKDIANIRTRGLFEAVGSQTQIEKEKAQELLGTKMNVAFVKIDTAAVEKELTKEKADVAFKALEEALEKGDAKLVDEHLATIKGTWSETGLVDLGNENLPKLENAVANSAAFELSKDQPLLNRLVRDGNNKFVLKLKDTRFEKAAPLEKMAMEMAQKRRSDSMFESWINKFRADSLVTVNSQAMQLF